MYTLGSVGKVEGETGLLTSTTWTQRSPGRRRPGAGGALGQQEVWSRRRPGAREALSQEEALMQPGAGEPWAFLFLTATQKSISCLEALVFPTLALLSTPVSAVLCLLVLVSLLSDSY